jgi:DNA-binding HxlR family transcriptional regulator
MAGTGVRQSAPSIQFLGQAARHANGAALSLLEHAVCNLHDDSFFPILPFMQRKSFRTMSCPIARSLERVGEWWSMLIMRDALHGLTRFDEFQNSLGIAPNMLTRRLGALVAAGLLERRLYSDRPPRHEYVPTARGREFRAVLIALMAFGNRHFTPEGKSVIIVDAQTGAEAEPVVVDRVTGKPIREPEFAWMAGPAAGESTRRRYARRALPPGTAGVPPAPSLPASTDDTPVIGTQKKPGRIARLPRKRSP